MIKDIYTKKKIIIENQGSELRDYIEVYDLIRIIDFFLNKNISGYFNVVSGNSLSICDISKIILSYINIKTETIFLENKRKKFNLVFDNSKLMNLLPNFNFTTIEKGIKNYIHNI